LNLRLYNNVHLYRKRILKLLCLENMDNEQHHTNCRQEKSRKNGNISVGSNFSVENIWFPFEKFNRHF